jgi:hypothetical protein
LRRVPSLEANVYWRAYREALAKHASWIASRASPLCEDLSEEEEEEEERDAEQRLAEARTACEDPVLQITSAPETRPRALSNLWRHEAALLKSVQKNLHELQRLQAARAGVAVPVPAVVDVNFDLGGLGFRHDRQ